MVVGWARSQFFNVCWNGSTLPQVVEWSWSSPGLVRGRWSGRSHTLHAITAHRAADKRSVA